MQSLMASCSNSLSNDFTMILAVKLVCITELPLKKRLQLLSEPRSTAQNWASFMSRCCAWLENLYCFHLILESRSSSFDHIWISTHPSTICIVLLSVNTGAAGGLSQYLRTWCIGGTCQRTLSACSGRDLDFMSIFMQLTWFQIWFHVCLIAGGQR